MQRTVVVALAAALTLAGTGCGGSDDEPTRAEFAKQVNAVCVKARQGLKGQHGADFIARYVASQRAKAEGIAKLTPPDALKGPYEQYKRVLAARADLMERYLPAVKQGKKPPLTAEGVELANREEELIDELHAAKCTAVG